ncbi:Zinc finger protein [Musa troglodytarum]|uniref:Zinc finger protein n=1 Tax=Musa troglodytarum TaxID=320322 RepID=A0A9E7EM29_9LILI|nr:Zinc finger protein [Musa troglodytarum]
MEMVAETTRSLLSSRGAQGQQSFDTDSTPPLCNALLPSLLAIASLQKQQGAHQAFLLRNPTPEPEWPAGFPDILTTAFLDGTGDPSGSLDSIDRGGYGDAADSNEEEQKLLLPFRGGLGGATTTTAAAFDVDDEDDKTLIGSLLP